MNWKEGEWDKEMGGELGREKKGERSGEFIQKGEKGDGCGG